MTCPLESKLASRSSLSAYSVRYTFEAGLLSVSDANSGRGGEVE
jgi:hypothetical protein